MKHLPKHLRPRWRYLGVRIDCPTGETVGRRPFQRELWYAGQNLLGDPGSADAVLSVVRFSVSSGGGSAIVKVRRGEEGRGRAALACVDAVGGTPVGLSVGGVGGTIRATEENHL